MSRTSRKHSDEEILRLVASSDEFVVIASDFTDDLDYSRQQILNRLSELAEDGYLDTRTVGGRSRVFKLNDKGIKRIAQSRES